MRLKARRLFQGFCLSLLILPFLAKASTVEKRVDSYLELRDAIQAANERPEGTETLIYVLGEIVVPETPALTAIDSTVTIVGGRFINAGAGEFTAFSISTRGNFGIRDATFNGWSSGSPDDVRLFDNAGTTLINQVRFELDLTTGVCFRGGCFTGETALIRNQERGNLKIRNTEFTEATGSVSNLDHGAALLENHGSVTLERVQTYLDSFRSTPPISNSGMLQISNGSFLKRNLIDLAHLPFLQSSDKAISQTVNSVYDGFSGSDCARLVSEGHNTHTAPDCIWTGPADQVGVRTGLIWRSSGNESFELTPSAASPLIDSADQSRCPELFIFWDSDGDGIEECDRGAVELAPIALAEGGINGLYYNPDEDGHYLTIQQTRNTTLVIWNTFDAQGNPAWIFGTGTLVAGRSVIAEAFINRATGLAPGGNISGLEVEPWGSFELDMTSCTDGMFSYRSNLPEFGTGQFAIQRLSVVKQLGCIDP